MSRSYQISPEWKRLSDEIVKSDQCVLVLGASDAGKTTFCQYLIDTVGDKSIKSALVDSDIGQSRIGPPTTIGMKLFQSCNEPAKISLNANVIDQNESADNNLSRSSDQSVDALYFVGSISPIRNLLPVLTGTRLMVDAAKDAGAEFIVIDTTGFVHEHAAVMLKQQKIDLIRPDHVVCIGRSREMEKIVASYKDINWLKIHHIQPHKLTREKNSQLRRSYRQNQFHKYFKNSSVQKTPFDQFRGARTPFFKGRIANQKELENLSQITDEEILFAEWGHREVALIVGRRLLPITIEKLRDYLSLSFISDQTLSYFEHRIVGLVDEKGDTIGIGIIESVDFPNQELNIRTQTGILSESKVIQFGEYQLFDTI